jgi:hypothetical protein
VWVRAHRARRLPLRVHKHGSTHLRAREVEKPKLFEHAPERLPPGVVPVALERALDRPLERRVRLELVRQREAAARERVPAGDERLVAAARGARRARAAGLDARADPGRLDLDAGLEPARGGVARRVGGEGHRRRLRAVVDRRHVDLVHGDRLDDREAVAARRIQRDVDASSERGVVDLFKPDEPSDTNKKKNVRRCSRGFAVPRRPCPLRP